MTTRTTPNVILSPTQDTLEAGESVGFSLTSSADTTGFSYQWSTPGLFGTLSDTGTGGSGNAGLKSFCTNSSTATFVANTSQTVTSPLTDTVTVLAYQGAGCVADQQFGRTSTAQLTLQTKPTLIETPTQMLGHMVASDGNTYAIGATVASIPFNTINFPANYYGDTLFRITPSGQVSAIVDFKYPQVVQGLTSFSSPALSPVVEGPDDALYGVTQTGPTASDYGYFYRVSLADYSVTILQVFQDDPTGTVFPQAKYGPPLLASDGNFYINSNLGVVKLNPYGQASLVNRYPSTVGEAPYPLMQASDGNLYTVNWSGGPVVNGVATGATLVSISLGGNSSTVYTFPPPTFGANSPNSPLVEGADGALYTTVNGERPGFNALRRICSRAPTFRCCAPIPAASVFRYQPNGGASTIYNFTSLPDGTTPGTGLTAGPDGSLYGTATAGGDTNPECYDFDPFYEVEPGGTLDPTITVRG